MLEVERLQRREPAAWTDLLNNGHDDTRQVIVAAVSAERVGGRSHVYRYIVAMAGCSDPTTLIGKRTNATEAYFYQEIAPRVPAIVPHCWFSRANGDESWLVLDDVPEDCPIDTWTAEDVEGALSDLATLHAAYWDQHVYLDSCRWLPKPIGPVSPSADEAWLNNGWSPFVARSAGIVSEHALKNAGELAPMLSRAAAGLQVMRALGGWPGVLRGQQMEAAADLLDDPVPMLQLLRELPATIIHTNPSMANWRLTLFEDRRLLDWKEVAAGPAAYDLVAFIEQYGLLCDCTGKWQVREEWPISVETMVDTYILCMAGRLGRRFNARALRQAIPAARCLYVLTHWLPRLGTWFEQIPSGRGGRKMVSQIEDGQLVHLRPYLADLFDRFLSSYKKL